MTELNEPLFRGVSLSSHSSGSAIATLPTPLTNSVLRWFPATVAHHSRLAKVQPFHSVTPCQSAGSSGTGSGSNNPLKSLVLSIDQPTGGALVHVGTMFPASSSLTASFMPRRSLFSWVSPLSGRASKFSAKSGPVRSTLILSMAQNQLFPASVMPQVMTMEVAAAGFGMGMVRRSLVLSSVVTTYSSSETGAPPLNETLTLAFWAPSGRKDESKTRDRLLARRPAIAIGGVFRKLVNFPKAAGLPLSSHSSGSAMATVPTPRANSSRR